MTESGRSFTEIFKSFEAHLGGKRLWHYTSDECARKIIEGGILRLASSRFMNDPDEGRIAADLVDSAARRLLKEARSNIGPQRAEILESELLCKRWIDSDEVFLMSFGVQEDLSPDDEGNENCARETDGKDSLSQWAMYGDDAKGVALVFEALGREMEPLFEIASVPYSCVPEFVRVKYYPSQRSEIVALMSRLLSASSMSSRQEFLTCVQLLRWQLQPKIKSDFYAQEHECRLVVSLPADLAGKGYLTGMKHIKFTADGRPYLESVWKQGLKLVEYWLGPRRTQGDTAAARLFLGQLGYGDVKVRNSHGSYRGKGG